MFIIIGLTGLVILLIGILFDGVFDFLDDSVIPALGVAFTVFGASGLISLSVTDETSKTHIFLTSLIFSALLTIIFVLVWKAVKKRNSSEMLEEITIKSILGTKGEVIRWSNSNNGGEAIFTYLGGNTVIDITTEDNTDLNFGDVVRAVKQVDNKFIVEKVS